MPATAATQTTILDIAKANGSDAVVGLIEESIVATPEIEILPARTIKGLNYKTFVRTALPNVPFRQANQGATQTKSTYENRTVETYILNPRVETDKAVADGHEDGAAAWMASEADGVMRGAWVTLATQMYYGTANDANGFPGLVNAYDATNLTVDAGGTTAITASSVWMVKFGPQYTQWVFGLNGQLSLSDVMINPAATDANGNQYTAYLQEINARPGLQLGSLLGVGRIKNLTNDVGKGLTDTLLAKLLSQFKVGVRPDAIFMTRRSREQLQASRSVTLFGQANQKLKGSEMTLAPTPVAYEDIPIYATDAISNTEAIQ
jgi:hypothetical protein